MDERRRDLGVDAEGGRLSRSLASWAPRPGGVYSCYAGGYGICLFWLEPYSGSC